MECFILNDCSLGVLPADLMTPIVLQSNWRGAMAVALSCKYWYKLFREKIVHPMIAYLAGEEWFMVRRGQIYTNQRLHQHGRKIFDSEFDTIYCIMKMKEKFQAALTDEKAIEKRRENPGTCAAVLKIRLNEKDETLIARNTPDDSLKISLLRDFLENDVLSQSTLDERPGNVIKIDIGHSVIPSIALSIHVDIWGNIQYSYVRCRLAARTSFNLKRDPKLFFDLRDILVYTKHSKSVTFPKEERSEDHQSFRATYVTYASKKTYQVQHLIVTKDEQVTSVVTNDYKKDAIAKIIRLLTATLAGSLDRCGMNAWASTTSLVAPWNSLIIQPIKLQSNLKDENISCVRHLYISGQTSKTARIKVFELEVTFDGTISLEIRSRGPKNTVTTVYEREARLPDINRVQQFLNEFDVIENVRNRRDETITSTKRKTKEEKITQHCHALPKPFCGAKLVSVQYRPFTLTDSAKSLYLSPKGFEFVWKNVMEFVKETNIL